MPDESCRKCGGELARCAVCSECRDVISHICTQCGYITKERFHSSCFYFVETEAYTQAIAQ